MINIGEGEDKIIKEEPITMDSLATTEVGETITEYIVTKEEEAMDIFYQ